MNFWDKKGDNGNMFDDELLDSSDLLDVSNLDIPLSDQNDQYNEEVPIEGGNVQSFPSFLDTTSKKAPAIPKQTGSNTPFMAPPIPSATMQNPSMQMQNFDQTTEEENFPELPEDDIYYEDELPELPLDEQEYEYEEDLPPLPVDEEEYEEDLPALPTEEEYEEDLPALPTEEEYEEDLPALPTEEEYEEDLPPLPTEEEYEEDLPPLPTEEEYEEDLPPLPTEEEYEEDLPPLPTEEEYEEDLPPLPTEEECEEDLPPLTTEKEYEEDLPPLPTEEEYEEDLPPLPTEEEYEEDLPPLPTEEEYEEDLPPLPSDEAYQTQQSTNIEETAVITDEANNEILTKQEKPQKAEEEFYIRTAQAPRSKTFVKQAETLLESAQPQNEKEEKNEADDKSSSQNDDIENLHYSNPLFLRKLFANGNTCITAPGATFQLKEDLRSLLALFSNGRYFVAETYKYDGKVLSFEYLVKKRNLQIGKPEYVPMNVLSTIYEYAAQNTYADEDEDTTEKPDVVEQAQARMQRDFITIVSRAAAMHVSDIHVVVAENTIVMFRVNGLMQTEMEYKKEWGESFVRAAFASADISDANYAQNEYQAAQKLGRTPLRGSHGKLVLPKNILGIRLQFNPIAFGTRYVVLRLLYAEENIETSSALEALGFTKKDTEAFYKLRGEPTGITIISGPTGSGKSTTLQRNMIAMLQERNYEVNLITVEDPPEYPIPGARQMPVTNATIEEAKEREFTKALAAALRSDPDSMMIGEVRTLSAADLAFRAALSGHNVWTTLHANNAPAILIRLKDMGVEEFKLKDPEIMKGLTAQRLFRRLCPHCRVATTNMLNSPIVQRLREGFGDVALETTYLRGPGCRQCDFKGVKGRIAVSEIILPDATFLDLMMKGDTVKATNYWINELNGTTLRESALRHMFNGIIDVAEVERWTGFLNQTITG